MSRGKRAGLRGRALLALSQHATSRDVLQAMLQVAHLRHLPFRRDLDAEQARRWALEESAARAGRDIDVFVREMVDQGWQSGLVMLSSSERAPYSVASGADLAADLATALAVSWTEREGGAVGGSGGGAGGATGAA